MTIRKNYFFLLCIIVGMMGCKGKKKASLDGEDPVEISDFIEFFPESEGGYQLSDSILKKKDKDSLLISYKVFTQFVPDSLLSKWYGKTKPRIFPIARVEAPGAETYLFIKTVSGEKKGVYLVCFDKKDQYITGMQLLKPGLLKIMQTVTLDRRFTLTRSSLRRNADGSMNEGKEVFVLNTEAKDFMLIMTEALDDKLTELINPIDTLPRKHKFSADYSNGKMNLVSIRDGRKPDRLNFYIHVEKNNGTCTGELKGEALFRTATTAEYREEGDPCVLKFSFSNNMVILKELEGCGSRRGVQCSFDGSHSRKREAKPKTVKPKNR